VAVQGVNRVAYILGKDVPNRYLVAPEPPRVQLGRAWQLITKEVHSILNFVLSDTLRVRLPEQPNLMAKSR
jgi:hypothetical protein